MLVAGDTVVIKTETTLPSLRERERITRVGHAVTGEAQGYGSRRQGPQWRPGQRLPREEG